MHAFCTQSRIFRNFLAWLAIKKLAFCSAKGWLVGLVLGGHNSGRGSFGLIACAVGPFGLPKWPTIPTGNQQTSPTPEARIRSLGWGSPPHGRGDGGAGGICRPSCWRYCGDGLVITHRSFRGVFTVFGRWDPRWDPCVFAPIPADPAGFLAPGSGSHRNWALGS